MPLPEPLVHLIVGLEEDQDTAANCLQDNVLESLSYAMDSICAFEASLVHVEGGAAPGAAAKDVKH